MRTKPRCHRTLTTSPLTHSCLPECAQFSGDNGPAIEQIPKLPPALWFGMTLGISIAEALRIQAGFANPYDGETRVQGEQLGAPRTAYPREDTTFQRLRPGYTPGDLGFDPLGLAPTDPAEFRQMQEKELSHGRLGMLAAAGFMAQEAVTGQTWGTFWGIPDF